MSDRPELRTVVLDGERYPYYFHKHTDDAKDAIIEDINGKILSVKADQVTFVTLDEIWDRLEFTSDIFDDFKTAVQDIATNGNLEIIKETDGLKIIIETPSGTPTTIKLTVDQSLRSFNVGSDDFKEVLEIIEHWNA